MSLLRSTKFVRYFTGAARTLILNSAKTVENNLLLNTKTICGANNILVRDYATTKKAESLEPLLQRLDSEVRRFGRITKRDIDEVFDEIRTRHDITSSQSLLVIRCCGDLVPEELPEQRTLLVQKIWSVLSERGVPMDISHYNALLRVYLENEHPFSPAEFLSELEKKGLQPNRVTYQRLMWRYCQDGDVDGATKVLERMRELGMPVSEPVLNALVMGHAFSGDTDGAKAVLDTMAGAGLQPSNRTYALLASGFAKKGDLQGVEDVIRIASDLDVGLTNKDILDIIAAFATSGHADKTELMLGHLRKQPGYNQDARNTILELINKGQVSVAKDILRTMSSKDESFYQGSFFVKQLLRVNFSNEVIQECRELQEDGTIPNAIVIAAEAALQKGYSKLAQELFMEMKKDGLQLRQHFYWPLLAKEGQEKNEEGLMQLIRDMAAKSELSPSGETLRDYIIPYLMENNSYQDVITKLQISNVPVIHAARNVMVVMLEKGAIKEARDIAVKYRPWGNFGLVGRHLIAALAKAKDVDAFTTILQVLNSGTQPSQTDTSQEESQEDIQNYGDNNRNATGQIVLDALRVLKSEYHEPLLTSLLAKGISISSQHSKLIEEYLGEKLTSNLSEILLKLTSSELEVSPIDKSSIRIQRSSAELELMITQGRNRNLSVVGLQKQLISAYILENQSEKLNSLLEELKSQDFVLLASNISQLIEFYSENGDVDNAMKYKKMLDEQYPDFSLNKYKFVQLAHVLVQANRFDEALKILQQCEGKSGEGASFLVQSRCFQILNQIAEQKDDVKIQDFIKVMTENNIVEPSNVLLGPLIKVHILKENLEGALAEFDKCCNQYRCTPWKGELMKRLIMAEDPTKLQWVADRSTQIHGEVNTLHDLVLAFVECGRLRQARRILETPGLTARTRRLDDACQRYSEDGKTECLEGLLEATRELSYIDRSAIFYHLVVSYCKSDETNKAIGLWTLLQEEGEVPSDKFLIHLGRHLKSKNLTVPFVIPEEKPVDDLNRTAKVHETEAKENTTTDFSVKIEKLIQNGDYTDAIDSTVASIKSGAMPKLGVMRYLFAKLSVEGNVEGILTFNDLLTPDLKKKVAYDNKLTKAKFVHGSGTAHVQELWDAFQSAETEADLGEVVKMYPRSAALMTILDQPDLLSKCREIAEKLAEKDKTLPANLLWMEYVIAGRDQDAEIIYQKYLVNANQILFKRLVQEAFVTDKIEVIETLLRCLKMNSKISAVAVGNIYSRLIDLHLKHNRVDNAREVLERAISEGTPSEHIHRNSVNNLKQALQKNGQQFKFLIPSNI